MLQVLTWFSIFAFSLPIFAGDVLAENKTFYYGDQIEAASVTPITLESQTINIDKSQSFLARSKFSDLKEKIHFVLNSFHISRSGDFDEIVDFCHVDDNDNCYSHVKHSYKNARMYLFGDIHLIGSDSNSYKIESHYCREWISNDEFPEHNGLGPMQIPAAQIMNTEHTWPQSKFSSNFPASYQKSDLHALYPTLSSVNSTRGNESFGEVEEVISIPCPESALGRNKYNERVFEPSEEVKGNVARAKFYFSTRYNISIPAHEEAVLREWHKIDPVDQEEQDRADRIFEIQHVRNPFVDNPGWVDQINDF